MYLFGFGSLINLKSAQKSFQRVLKQNDLIPVQIRGYERVWNAIESIQFNDEVVNGVFLNIQKNENATMFGVVIELSKEELEILKLREKNYACIEIDAKNVLNKKFDTPLMAFMTTNNEKIAQKGDANSFIPARYIDVLQEALGHYEEIFVNDFKKSLESYPFSLKEGDYHFTDPLQQAAAREGMQNDTP